MALRPRFKVGLMSDGTETGKPMSTADGTATTEPGTEPSGEQKQQEGQTVTQAEVDRIVRERVARERAKFADYDDLKAKAEGSKTLEERLASLETELTTTKAEALKTRIAAKFGVSTEPGKNGEPSDADLFLTGNDEETLTAQAQRLAAREADRKKQGNVAPNEGKSKNSGGDERVAFVGDLFGSAD